LHGSVHFIIPVLIFGLKTPFFRGGYELLIKDGIEIVPRVLGRFEQQPVMGNLLLTICRIRKNPKAGKVDYKQE
jgi:hypothetical protein